MAESLDFTAKDFTAKATVLVVDDGPDNLALISGLLNDLYKIVVATNGEKALEIARSATRPDLVLLDVLMPGISGYEVCKQIKGNPYTRNIPVIFLTSLTSEEDEGMGLGLGAEDYITKPVNPAILRARVKTHLRIKAAIDFLTSRVILLERELKQRDSAEIARALKAVRNHLAGKALASS